MLTTNYLPVIQDISHDQITESRSCGTDDATAAAAAADAADAAAAAAGDAADAAAANAEAGLSWGRVQHVQLDRSRTICKRAKGTRKGSIRLSRGEMVKPRAL